MNATRLTIAIVDRWSHTCCLHFLWLLYRYILICYVYRMSANSDEKKTHRVNGRNTHEKKREAWPIIEYRSHGVRMHSALLYYHIGVQTGFLSAPTIYASKVFTCYAINVRECLFYHVCIINYETWKMVPISIKRKPKPAALDRCEYTAVVCSISWWITSGDFSCMLIQVRGHGMHSEIADFVWGKFQKPERWPFYQKRRTKGAWGF